MILLLLALAVPNPAITPGLVRPLTTAQVCSVKWGKDARHVTTAMKQHIAQAYGISWYDHQKYEFDHLIPRELGGADDPRNIWAQKWTGPWNARDKDRLENETHKRVCAGIVKLDQAQHKFATDWKNFYVEIFGVEPESAVK